MRQQQEAAPTAPEHALAAIAAPTLPPSPPRSPPGPPLGLVGWGADDEGAGPPPALPGSGAPGAPNPGAPGPLGPGAQPGVCLPLPAQAPAALDASHSLGYLLQPVISLPLQPQLPAPSVRGTGTGAGAGAWAQQELAGCAAWPSGGPAAATAGQVAGHPTGVSAARKALMQRFREDSARLDARIRTAQDASSGTPLQQSMLDPQVGPTFRGAPAGGRPSSTPPACETAAKGAAPRASQQQPAGAPSALPPVGPPSSHQSPGEGLSGWAAAAAGEAECSSMLDFLRQSLLAADGETQGPVREGTPREGPQAAPGADERAKTSEHAQPSQGLGAGPQQGSGLGQAVGASAHVVQVAAQLRASVAAQNGDSVAAAKRPRSADGAGALEAQGAAASKAPRLA